MKKIDVSRIQKYVDSGHIVRKYNADKTLCILNYTNKCTYDSAWDDFTKMCRGLIIKEDGTVVGRCMNKFFNLNEKEECMLSSLPNEPFEVYTKEDGCFLYRTKINTWDNKTICIGDIVSKKEDPILIGMNENGELVPTKIIKRFNNGTKKNWMEIETECPVSKKTGSGKHKNKIKITKNHHMFINGKFVPAIDANIGDNLTTWEFIPCDKTIHFIKSSLLGDGSITKSYNSVRFSEGHKIDHLEFLDFIKKSLGENLIKERTVISGYGTKMMQISSMAFKSLKFLRSEWYKNGKKIIPYDLDWMDDFSVAKWMMDDGCLSHSNFQKDRAIFSTNGFYKKDTLRLSKKLEEMYGVSCSLGFKSGWYIRVNSGKNNSISNMWKKITPHIIPAMRYKVPEEYRNMPYLDYGSGRLKRVKNNSKITNIKNIDYNKKNFPSGAVGFDIQTETGNYFANGVLVHNSMGLTYFHNKELKIATRGSFNSDQAIWATNFLKRKKINGFNPDYTYIFEIIYKENRIVTDYGNFEGLILLTAIDLKDWRELSREEVEREAKIIEVPLVQCHSFNSIDEILDEISDWDTLDEGFVVKFKSGYRIKIKSKKYLEVCRIVQGMTPLAMWGHMENGIVSRDFMEAVPEEFRDQLEELAAKFESIYADRKSHYEDLFNNLPEFSSRKECALHLQKYHKVNMSPLMNLFVGNSIDKFIMKEIRPTGNEM